MEASNPLPADAAERYVVLDTRVADLARQLRETEEARIEQDRRASEARARILDARRRADEAATAGEAERAERARAEAKALQERWSLERSVAANLRQRARSAEKLLAQADAERTAAANAILRSSRAAEQWARAGGA